MAFAVAVYAGDPVAVAVIVQPDTTAGAVNTPELEIAPQESDQLTGWLAVKVTMFSACRFAVAGVKVIGDVTVTLVDAVVPLPSVAFTVTWHVPGASGAV